MTDTQPPKIPPMTTTAGSPRAVPGVVRVAAVAAAALSLALSATVALSAVIPAQVAAEHENPRTGLIEPTPYARVPSVAQPVADRVRFGDLEGSVELFESDGSILFVTVSAPEQSLLSWIVGRDEAAIEFLTTEEKFGLQTPEQRRVFSLESMRTAEQVAQYVALNRLGFAVEVMPGDVLIQQMVCLEADVDGTQCLREAPAAQFLQPGDRLLEIDGRRLATVDDVTAALEGKRPGDRVEVRLEREGSGELVVDVELTSAPDEESRTIIGFFPFDTRRVELPFELAIDTGSIGGPSAGLAFTLALIDELSSGRLTGGVPVAVTGTIELDGSVGAVGGLRQKAAAAAAAGAQVFLVPADQSDEDLAAARRAGGDLEIIRVANLDEALAALERLGGDPVQIATTDGS